MPEYKMRLELSRIGGDQPINIIEETVSRTSEATPQGQEALGVELAAEFRKAIRFHEHLAEIPNVQIDLIDSPSHTIDFSQWWDVRNTENLWLEISNTLIDVRFLLAQAKEYKALEPSEEEVKQERRFQALQFASIVHMDAYRKLHSEHYQLDSPVDICVESCVEKVMHWYMFAYKAGLDFEEHYYFDQGEPFEAVFKAKVNREIKKAEELGQHSIWSHITHIGEAPMRKTPGLQIADMFAWANNREAAKLSPRWQALALAMRTLMPTLWVTWDEKTLRQFYRPLKPQAI
jgi:hypothetical protein